MGAPVHHAHTTIAPYRGVSTMTLTSAAAKQSRLLYSPAAAQWPRLAAAMPDVTEMITRLRQAVPFAGVILPRFWPHGEEGTEDVLILLTDYPPEYVERARLSVRNGGLIVGELLRTRDVVLPQDVVAAARNDERIRQRLAYREMLGLALPTAIVVRRDGRVAGVFLVDRGTEPFTPAELEMLGIVGRAVFERLDACIDSAEGPAKQLTPRELECVRLAARGFTAEETAVALRMARDTANAHIRNATRKLKARNKPHLVAICCASGLIV